MSAPRHNRSMLSHNELLDELRRLRDAGQTTNARLAELLELPTSRIADIFATDRKPRMLKVDEAKVLIEHFGLEPTGDIDFNEQTLVPILNDLLPLVPRGNVSESAVEALALALKHALALLPARGATPASEDQMKMAARAAVLRFREALPA